MSYAVNGSNTEVFSIFYLVFKIKKLLVEFATP